MTDNRDQYATYAWLITHDSIAEPDEPIGTNCNARGVVGPHNVDPELQRTLFRAANVGKDKWQGTPVEWFKMYDDDGELYYTGVRMGTSEYEEGFEPLEDFGTPNAGATEIRYYNRETKEWETL